MANFATIRHQKIRSAIQHNSLNMHNERRTSSKNVITKNTYKNITLSPSAYKNFDTFVEAKKTDIRKANKLRKKGEKKARFPREVLNKKTQEKELPALSQEFIFSHSHKALTEEESILFLTRAHDFLKEWFKGCEVLSSVIHLDEKTPHLHFFVSYFDKTQNRFVQKSLSQAGKTDIDLIRAAFQTAVADEFDLIKQDGSVVDNHEVKADLEKSKLKDKIETLEKTALLKKILDTKKEYTAQATLSEKTALITTAEREKEELRSELSITKTALATQTKLAEKAPVVEVEKIEIIKEIEKEVVVEKTVYKEDTRITNTLKTQISTQAQTITSKESEISTLTKQNEALKQKIATLPSTDIIEELKTLKNDSSELHSENKKLYDQAVNYKNLHSQSKQEIKILDTKIKKSEKINKELNDGYSKIEEKIFGKNENRSIDEIVNAVSNVVDVLSNISKYLEIGMGKMISMFIAGVPKKEEIEKEPINKIESTLSSDNINHSSPVITPMKP
jgi:hypothetical protein